MGEYFEWVNVDKQEYISPGDYDLGNKRTESSCKGNILLRALRDLLSAEWKGCRIIFLGDESRLSDRIEKELYQMLTEQTEKIGCPGDLGNLTVYEPYINVSCLFKESEEEVRNEIRFYLEDIRNDCPSPRNEYGIDAADPYKGLFLREGKTFRYTLNHTKKTYYSPESVKVFLENGTECDEYDPLPFLMYYGRDLTQGPWVGDVIDVDDIAPSGYRFLSQIHTDW